MSKIYQLRNPFWLADTYVFSKMEFDLSLYEKGKVTTYPYVKVNPRNKIEETGSDIRNVFPQYKIDSIIEKSSIANKSHSLVYKVIDMQYWGGIVSRDTLHPTPNGFEIIADRRVLPSKSFWFDDHFRTISVATKERECTVIEYGEYGEERCRTTAPMQILMAKDYDFRRRFMVKDLDGKKVTEEKVSKDQLLKVLQELIGNNLNKIGL